MPTWGQLLSELSDTAKTQGPAVFDVVRRKYLALLEAHTKRNLILYASKWTLPGSPPQFISITEEDIQGFMEVMAGLHTTPLDLILHSPGGSPEATEALVLYLRSKFCDIRVFVPHAARSAATMLACAANQIVMGKHSFLGPIDPQVQVLTRHGVQYVPAQAILEQFRMAQKECTSDAKNVGVWLPILDQYGPSLLVQCQHADDLAKVLVSEWLERYMFAGEDQAKEKASAAAAALSKHSEFKTHARHLGRETVRAYGLNVADLEVDQTLQDLVLSVFHVTTHTFNATPAVKIVENPWGALSSSTTSRRSYGSCRLVRPRRTLRLRLRPPGSSAGDSAPNCCLTGTELHPRITHRLDPVGRAPAWTPGVTEGAEVAITDAVVSLFGDMGQPGELGRLPNQARRPKCGLRKGRFCCRITMVTRICHAASAHLSWVRTAA